MWDHRFPRYSLRGDPNQPAVIDFGSKNGRFPALAFGASTISTAALSGTVPSFVLFPSPSRPDRSNIEADALIIRRVEPQQPVKNTLGLLEPFQCLHRHSPKPCMQRRKGRLPRHPQGNSPSARLASESSPIRSPTS